MIAKRFSRSFLGSRYVRAFLVMLGLSLPAGIAGPLTAQQSPGIRAPGSGWPGEPLVGAIPIDAPRGDQVVGQLVVDVRVVGNESISNDRVVSHLRTRRDRVFDPELAQADKRRLITTGLFREVKVYLQNVAEGVVVTFQVFERPTIKHIRFVGDRSFNERKLIGESGLEVGEALNLYAIQEARRKLEEFYRGRGFPKATVSIAEGDKPEHRGVVFHISEGPAPRIAKVEFIGNTIDTDQRLKTQIQSKPGILWYFIRGKVDMQKIDEDKERLTAYYRGLGFFGARVGRILDYDEDQRWLTLRFVIDEGPRYVINNVSVIGNESFDTADLLSRMNLKTGEYFNLAKMNLDVSQLRDIYGSQGHIFADVEASPRFLIEQPGRLDLVYNVEEGKQFRVGRINIHIAGEFPHTKESVVRDRLSLRTGDIADISEVRASERRLKSSQLFEHDPANGKSPRIVIRPPQLSDADEYIGRGGGAVRGQSPDPDPARPDELELDVYLPGWPRN